MYKNQIECPFYEAHSGEYYQGMWEHNNLCWLCYENSSNPYCNPSCCWFFLESDKKMLDLFTNLLKMFPRYKKSIIKDMKVSIDALNQLHKRNLGFYV